MYLLIEITMWFCLHRFIYKLFTNANEHMYLFTYVDRHRTVV